MTEIERMPYSYASGLLIIYVSEGYILPALWGVD